ncbi:MAG TPA: hypothetical protein DCM07_12220 [Planctomycetaceae bacterium]|nr:hypothetical protein [Planctomycetaceae bacterium]
MTDITGVLQVVSPVKHGLSQLTERGNDLRDIPFPLSYFGGLVELLQRIFEVLCRMCPVEDVGSLELQRPRMLRE